ncbi:Conserved_hypothetical protein [Hexamita inflata]|uniref:Uncharacterized protein n=1 Tax=Hexamita inflata TaxID=28002 RepID=A0AA86PGH8_9EUKA|nr:Conserved hypothetical protein [Hexamita inflata]
MENPYDHNLYMLGKRQREEYLSQILLNKQTDINLLEQIDKMQQSYEQMKQLLESQDTFVSEFQKLVISTHEQIQNNLQKINVNSQVSSQLQEFISHFTSQTQILNTNAFPSENILKLCQKLIENPNFDFLYQKYKQNPGNDQISSVFSALINIHGKLVDNIKSQTALTLDFNNVVTLQSHIAYISKFEAKINQQPTNFKDLFQAKYPDAISLFLSQIKPLLAPSTQAFQTYTLSPQSNDISEINIIMPICSTSATKKFKYDQFNISSQSAFRNSLLKMPIKLNEQETLASTFMYDCNYNNRNQPNNDIYSQNSNLDILNIFMKYSLNFSQIQVDQKIFQEHQLRYLVLTIDEYATKLKNNYKKLTEKQLEISVLVQFIHHNANQIFDRMDLAGCINFFVQYKNILVQLQNQEIIQVMNQIYQKIQFKIVLLIKQQFAQFDEPTLSKIQQIIGYVGVPMTFETKLGIKQKEFVTLGQSLTDASFQCIMGIRIAYLIKACNQLINTSLQELLELVQTRYKFVISSCAKLSGKSEAVQKQICDKVDLIVQIMLN